jgi:hypothetical protein
MDLNRDYRHLQSPEVRAHINWLQRQPPFDLSLCLHEDWEAAGFYVYELNPDHKPSFAEKIIEAAATACPIDPSPVIEGRPAQNGIIRPRASAMAGGLLFDYAQDAAQLHPGSAVGFSAGGARRGPGGRRPGRPGRALITPPIPGA